MSGTDSASPYGEFPFDRITEVHWGSNKLIDRMLLITHSLGASFNFTDVPATPPEPPAAHTAVTQIRSDRVASGFYGDGTGHGFLAGQPAMRSILFAIAPAEGQPDFFMDVTGQFVPDIAVGDTTWIQMRAAAFNGGFDGDGNPVHPQVVSPGTPGAFQVFDFTPTETEPPGDPVEIYGIKAPGGVYADVEILVHLDGGGHPINPPLSHGRVRIKATLIFDEH